MERYGIFTQIKTVLISSRRSGLLIIVLLQAAGVWTLVLQQLHRESCFIDFCMCVFFFQYTIISYIRS